MIHFHSEHLKYLLTFHKLRHLVSLRTHCREQYINLLKEIKLPFYAFSKRRALKKYLAEYFTEPVQTYDIVSDRLTPPRTLTPSMKVPTPSNLMYCTPETLQNIYNAFQALLLVKHSDFFLPPIGSWIPHNIKQTYVQILDWQYALLSLEIPQGCLMLMQDIADALVHYDVHLSEGSIDETDNNKG